MANDQGQIVWRWDQHEPFGVNVADENPSGLGAFGLPLRFPGQTYDGETGLHYNYYRDYDPSLGSYKQSDLIGLRGGLNTYMYVAEDPLRNIDRLGLLTLSLGAGGAGNLGPMGLGADSGVAIDPLYGTLCIYTARCYMVGWNTPVGGSIGLVGSVGQGRLCSGTQTMQGAYYFGGRGLGGEAQVQYGGGGLQYGRGIVGPTAGAGAGYIHCEITHYCVNEPKECKGGKCK